MLMPCGLEELVRYRSRACGAAASVGAGSDPRGPMRKAFDSAWTQLDTSARLTLQRCAVCRAGADSAALQGWGFASLHE